MKEEDKDLLLKELCGRLPYGVIVRHSDTNIGSEGNLVAICTLDDITTTIINEEGYEDVAFLIESKPYLRPMSSMTDDEEEEYRKINLFGTHWGFVDWCNKKHFDYRSLIEKGLAIKVTDENNPYEKH